MPSAPRGLCLQPGCPAFAEQGGRCQAHARAVARTQDRQRAQATPYRRLYQTARWQALRTAYLAAHPLCECDACAGRLTPASVVHHRMAHRGDLRLFFDPDNLQALAKRCHDRITAAETREIGRAHV